MCCGNFRKFFSYHCVDYAVKVLFSLIILGVAVAGMLGAFTDDYICYSASLITLVAGMWIKQPRLKWGSKKKDKNKPRLIISDRDPRV